MTSIPAAKPTPKWYKSRHVTAAPNRLVYSLAAILVRSCASRSAKKGWLRDQT
jgi:hypothetical protein